MNQTLISPASPPPARGFDLPARLRAAAIHLALSALVAALAAALVFGLWYPSPFREISGGRELFTLIVAVDVVLGPLITFAVFNRRKPRRELVRDLALVVLVQIAALGYGLQTVFSARPVVLALETDRLRVVRAIDLDAEAMALAPPDMRRLPWSGVQVVATRKPRTDEFVESVQLGLAGIDLGMRPQFWLPSNQTAAAVAAAARLRPLEELIARQPNEKGRILDHVTATGRPTESIAYLPLLARTTDWVAFIDTRNGEIAGYAQFNGF